MGRRVKITIADIGVAIAKYVVFRKVDLYSKRGELSAQHVDYCTRKSQGCDRMLRDSMVGSTL